MVFVKYDHLGILMTFILPNHSRASDGSIPTRQAGAGIGPHSRNGVAHGAGSDFAQRCPPWTTTSSVW